MHKFNLGVRADRPGPQYASDAVIAATHTRLEERRDLGAFWPLEWRLVVRWAAALAEIDRDIVTYGDLCDGEVSGSPEYSAYAGRAEALVFAVDQLCAAACGQDTD